VILVLNLTVLSLLRRRFTFLKIGEKALAPHWSYWNNTPLEDITINSLWNAIILRLIKILWNVFETFPSAVVYSIYVFLIWQFCYCHQYLVHSIFYSATKQNEILSIGGKWMELENIILREGREVQKAKGHKFSLICGL
jgi:hypothetical protein